MSADVSENPTPSGINERDRAVRWVTRLSVGIALGLIVLKAFALGASGSVSMLASLTDSALDLVASVAVFFAVRWAAVPADEGHRFGHGKAEALAALVQSGLIFASAIFIGWEAILRIVDPRPIDNGLWAVVVLLISVVATLGLVWVQGRALRQSSSIAVAADRAHYSGDLAASAVVLIGLVSGFWLRAPAIDAAAGLVVAIWLFWGGWQVLRTAADPLLDRAAPQEDHAAIVKAVQADPAIQGLHRLRTRKVGPLLTVQMHIDLDPDLTLFEAHAIIEAAEQRILAAFPEADILIHPDPFGAKTTSVPGASVPVTPATSTSEPGDAGPLPKSSIQPSGPWG